MKLSHLIAGLLVGTAMIAIPARVSAATPDSPTCMFKHEFGVGKGFTAANGTVSVNVIIEGNSSCRKDFVVASFKIPHETLKVYPLEAQTLYDYKAMSNKGPGTYKMTVKVPDCYHQVDLARGTNPTGPNGRLPYEAGRMLNAYVGGTKSCIEKPVTPTPVTPVATPPAPTPTTLPKTGTGSVLATILGVSAISAGLYSIVQRRRTQ
jgi:LPXTG-motif cell wall-anchored protein